MVDVIRKICTANAQTEFKFQATSVSFLIKNFTSSDILVCLHEWDTGRTVKIAAGMWECIRTNPDPERCMTRSTADTVIVQANQTGEVEVRRDD